ncbi:MAG: LysM peptidoglycan-binding domain-containing protein [Anaerocolumna sp.]
MDNSYSKGGNTNNQSEPGNTIPVKMPKNIRQVGNIGSRNKVIYVEDYVMTYIKQLSDKEHSGCRITVLLGYYVSTEEIKNIFIKGAVEMVNTDFSGGITFSDEGWTSIYENIKKYFSEVEIVGWSLVGPEFFIESGEKVRKIHVDNFSGPDKVLLKMDSMEKEETFYLNENNQLVKQSGYYIYYEKNEEMQNYMVENKEAVSDEKNYNDCTTRKIRNVIQEKKEVKDDRSVIRLLYAASTLLAIIVLVIAATMLDNYDKMRNMETTLNTISQSLTLVKDDEKGTPEYIQTGDGKQTGDETQAAGQSGEDSSQAANADAENDIQRTEGNAADNEAGFADNDSSVKDQETTEVETVKGNINNKQDAENTPADEADSNQSADNNKQTDNPDADNPDNNIDTAKADNQDTGKPGEADKASEDSVETSAPIKYYLVRHGDSLAGISYELYNTFSYMDEIKELNGIEDENKIYEGQKLIVP